MTELDHYETWWNSAQEKAQEMRQEALREAAKLKILQEEEAQLRWIFELIFKPKQRKSDLKKVCQVSFLRKIMSKSRNLVKFLGVATLQSKLYAKQLEAENATWSFYTLGGWWLKPWMVSSQIVSKAF